jgi:hypothetical protein
MFCDAKLLQFEEKKDGETTSECDVKLQNKVTWSSLHFFMALADSRKSFWNP